MTLYEAVADLTSRLNAPFIDNPETEARLIICHLMQFDVAHYILNKNDTIVPSVLNQALNIVQQRLSGRSLASILGSQPFYDSVFTVNDDVLIPRPETELLVEHILNIRSNIPTQVLEIGVGSGIITITLAKHRSQWRFTAIDISENAVRTAIQNAQTILDRQHNCAINISRQDFFQYNTSETFDIIVSNPPYIPSDETTRLLESKTVSDPRISLDGGADGLDFYRHILTFADTHLSKNGTIVVEHAFDQRQALSDMASQNGYEYQCHKDYAGLDRYSEMKKICSN